MTDYKEEQIMEIEALESIYMDDFQIIRKNFPFSYKIHIVPNQDGINNYVELDLIYTIPENYPDFIPQVEMNILKGLGNKELQDIQKLIHETANENIGTSMVYAISESVREYLVENNNEGNDGSEYHLMLLRMQKNKSGSAWIENNNKDNNIKKEEFDNSIVRPVSGTPVTVETFLIWKKSFDLEKAMEKSNLKSTKENGDIKKLTGRQLWQQGLTEEIDEENDNINEEFEEIEEQEDQEDQDENKSDCDEYSDE